MPLTVRLVVLVMLALMGITGAFDYLRLVRDRERLVDATREDLRVFAETLALAVSRNVRWGRTSAELGELLEDILARPGLTAVAIFDPDGKVIAQTVAPGARPPERDAMVRAALATRLPSSLIVEVGPSRELRHVQPFRWPGGRNGAIEARQSLDGVAAAFRREIRDRVLWRGLVLLLYVFSLALLTRWSIARPIDRLIRAAEAVGRGDWSQRILGGRRDEIGRLAQAFNQMAGDLETMHRQLLQQNEERLRLEQDVHEAQKLAGIGRLATEVAHEIGTPLNVIAGRAEMLERLLPPDHPGRRHLALIQAQSDRIGGIVRTLLEYSRRRQPVLRDQAIVPILARTVELLRERCRRRDVRVRLDLTPGLPDIRGDPEQLQELFVNLLSNAIDASSPGGVVVVAAGPEPSLSDEGRATIARGEIPETALVLRIVDAGEGIAPERLATVFQPFVSPARDGGGFGTGLPTVEDIVRAHRGAIEVASVPGRGTEVTVWLPLATDHPVAARRPRGPAAAADSHDG
ncbi:MAG TPA: HAMP domain-containing sensor histidine kinase [Methylomirabilota bacterium]|nr:HAMP domain-containing sensor histidine kinase [Methylomirabilota bacterium]